MNNLYPYLGLTSYLEKGDRVCLLLLLRASFLLFLEKKSPSISFNITNLISSVNKLYGLARLLAVNLSIIFTSDLNQALN